MSSSDLRTRVAPSGPFVVADALPRPIIASGGDLSQAEDVVGPGLTIELVESVLDTTGTEIAGVILSFTTQVKFASTVALAKCVFDVLLDGAPLTTPIGATVQADVGGAQPIVSVAFSGNFVMLPAGAHTIKIRCTSDANTTATVNPGGTASRCETLLFFAG